MELMSIVLKQYKNISEGTRKNCTRKLWNVRKSKGDIVGYFDADMILFQIYF